MIKWGIGNEIITGIFNESKIFQSCFANFKKIYLPHLLSKYEVGKYIYR